MATQVLSDDQIGLFKRDGFLCLRGFYDCERELLPIQRGIHGIIGLVIQKYGLPIEQAPFRAEAFDSGFQELIAIDRGHGYDPAPDYPASHGCMRLPISDAITVFNWLALGDWVDVYY